MRFLSPLALIGLALIALPIAIHLLVRQRARRLDFPSLKFLRETHSFRLRPRHIQQPLLLALRIAAIACLVVGLSRPLISINAGKSRLRVILLDSSLSMQAGGRTEASREQAHSIINRLGAGERAAIITFSTDSSLLAAMTSDKHKLAQAINQYQPESGPADYSSGLLAADALLRSEPASEIFIDIVSDFQSSGLARERLTKPTSDAFVKAQIITHPVGEEIDRNSFLVDEHVNTGESSDEIAASEIVVSGDERSGIRKNWRIDSREGERIDITWRTESNGQVTARIRTVTPDDFDADDERFLAFSSPQKARALLIEGQGDDAVPYLRAALDATLADFGDKGFTVDRKPVLPSSTSELGTYSVITLMLHRNPNVDELNVISDFARSGGTLWLLVGNDINTAEWNQFAKTKTGQSFPFVTIERKIAPHEATGFGNVDADAPALRSMSDQALSAIRTLRMRQGFAVTPRVDSATLMRWNDDTVVFTGAEVGRGRILLLATSPERAAGDLGISAAFPALASSVVQLSVTPHVPTAYEVGYPVNLGLEPNALVKVVDTKGKETTAQARDLISHAAAVFPFPGFFRVDANSSTKHVAINLPAAESESSLASAAEIEDFFKSPTEALESKTTMWHEAMERHKAIWRYFLFAAFVLLIVEMSISMKQRGRVNVKEER